MTQAAQRTFLITGASKGAGRALSRRLVSAGHRVVDLARGEADFPGVLGAVDLADHVATDTLLQERTRRFASEGVVDNVSLVKLQRIGRVQLDALDDVLPINLRPAVQTVQAIGLYFSFGHLSLDPPECNFDFRNDLHAPACRHSRHAPRLPASSLISTADAQPPIHQRAWSSQASPPLYGIPLCIWLRGLESCIAPFLGSTECWRPLFRAGLRLQLSAQSGQHS